MTRRYLVAGSIAAAVVIADLATKRMAAQLFADEPVTVIPGILAFTYTENPGAAFSLFQNAGPVLGAAAIVVSLAILTVLAWPRPMMEVIALGLVLGGALGNLSDRIARGPGLLDGRVIDWISLWPIPTFNVADAAVTSAVALLLIEAWRTR
ncbi:MAG: signal peptidase II [Actinobacteria bacterium]|nr:signal peptidase II [Actinomycetota bacterium]